eukprot:15461742-Alexandrium_andersonii.AAC.1
MACHVVGLFHDERKLQVRIDDPQRVSQTRSIMTYACPREGTCISKQKTVMRQPAELRNTIDASVSIDAMGLWALPE